VLNEMVCDGDGLESAVEWRYRRDVERAHRLPTPRRQVVIRSGAALYRRDIDYEEYRVVVELDGRRGHAGVGAFRDAARDNAALLAGRVTLRYGWWDVKCNACGSALQVATVLRARGWTGAPTPCGPTCAISAETFAR
jgi:very-short-patch-repair endonuclease